MSINRNYSLALAVSLGVLAGCSTPAHRTTDIAPIPTVRDDVPVMRDAPIVQNESSYVIVQTPEDVSQAEMPVVEPEVAIPSAADDLYERAKVIMQESPDAATQQIAVDLLTQASDMGHAESMRVLGLLALKEGPDRHAAAIALLERSAQTSVKAKRQLGILYGNLGTMHLDNTDKAIEYFQSASAMGDGESSLYLSKIMTKLGLDEDAQKWRDLAREQGVEKPAPTPQPPAMSQQDSVLKAYSLQRASMAGDAASMYQYAGLLLAKQTQGSLMGYEHSAEFEAYYWLRRASQMGNAQAAAKLQEVAYIEDLMANSKMTFDKLNRALGGIRS